MVTELGAYSWVILVRSVAETRFYCLLKCVSTGHGTNLTAISMGTGSERPGHDSDHSSPMVSRLMHRAIPPVSHIPSWGGAEWSTEKSFPLILCHISASCGAHQSAGWLVLNLSVGLFYHPSSSWNLKLNAQVVRIVTRLKFRELCLQQHSLMRCVHTKFTF